MSPTGLAIIYIIIWWIVFFAILPIDVDRIKIKKIEGEDPGSPENPKMLKKFLLILIATILASVSALSIEAKEVEWKVLQGLTVEEKKGKPVPKFTKELKSAMSKKISIKGFMIPLDYNSKKV